MVAQLAEPAEYTDCIFAEGKTLPISVLIYDTKQLDSEAPVMLELWEMWSTPSLPLLLLSGPQALSGST